MKDEKEPITETKDNVQSVNERIKRKWQMQIQQGCLQDTERNGEGFH
jgi:hypothetical protein